MKKIYQTLLNIGVYEEMPLYEFHRIRFVNFLQLFSQIFYILYAVLGLLLDVPFVTFITLGMLTGGLLGFLFQSKRNYIMARTMFLTSFSVFLFMACHVLNVGAHFIIFFFPAFLTYVLFYDIRKDLMNGIVNMGVSVTCALCSFALPNQMIMAVNVDESYSLYVRNFNYFVAFSITISFIIFVINHINRTGNNLVEVWKESERQKGELSEAKQKAEAAALAKTRFLSNMSHELRTPLNGIIGTVNLLLQEPMMNEQMQHYKVLKYSSEHMLGLINDVLDFSKIEAGKMELSNEVFNLKTSVNKIETIFKKQFHEKKVVFEMFADESLDRQFEGDETKLNQVLANLIGNALKFTSTGSVQCLIKLLSSNSQTARIYFSIKDTGVGMSEEKVRLIFNAFDQGETSTRRKFGGTGLGLTISKKIVSMFGGDLQVTSEEGKGSTFFFTIQLPFHQENSSFVNEKQVGKLKSLKGLRILVAEDSSVNMMITRKFLQRWDVTIHEATNGKEAVECFRKNDYDLMLIDLDMPVMDGYEALDEMKKDRRNIPAIAFTAAILPNMKENLEEKGFDDFLQKPFRPEDLHKKISLHFQSLPDLPNSEKAA